MICPHCDRDTETPKGPLTVAERQRACRARKKNDVANDVANHVAKCHDVTKNLSRNVTKFVPPTIAEVAAHCQARRNTVDAEAFVAFYESKGWRVGAQPMKSWTAAIVTWEKRSGSQGAQRTSKPSLFDGLKAFMEGE